MEILTRILDIALLLAVVFLTGSALVTAVRCHKKPGNQVGGWALFFGCLIGLIVSLVYHVISFLPPSVMGSGGPALPQTLYAILGVVNLVSTLLMLVGFALFRPLAAAGGAK